MNKYKPIPKLLIRILPFFLIAVAALTVLLYPDNASKSIQQRVVRVWNVDTFEGGKGSRTEFLKKIAKKSEKTNSGVYYLVSSYTLEGAKQAFREGVYPDLLSFGIGLSDFAELCLPLSFYFSGGETESGCLAYPWCRGGYALFSLDEQFDEEGLTAISCGGKNLPQIAAKLSQISGKEVESLAAYTGFLNGKYRYLLGTQRDLCRFAARKKTVYYQSLSSYCDLYQYISVLSAEKREDCSAFLQTLFSDEVQDSLSEIGMFPIDGQDNFIVETEKTISVFSSDETLKSLSEQAQGSEIKSLDKYLKNI